MPRSRPQRSKNPSSLPRLIAQAEISGSSALQRKRRMLAELCRLIGSEHSNPQYTGPGAECSPRVRQTLARLLAGDSEKQVAAHLRLSPHTVHVYVKRLYRHYDVCSRGELLARFITPQTKPQDATRV